MDRTTVRCLGCGLELPKQNLPVTSRYDASEECWQLYLGLTAYHLSRSDPEFIHQVAVDAYGAQHAGEATRPVTVAFALIGLYLAVERGYTGRRVQLAHTALAKQRIDWPRLHRPERRASLTVQDVLKARPGEERDQTLMKWAACVWRVWEEEHEWVRRVSREFLHVEAQVIPTGRRMTTSQPALPGQK